MRFPQEIVDVIIDKVAISDIYEVRSSHRDDPPSTAALRACSLAAHSFLYRSRLHLFAAITCCFDSHLSNFDRLLAESPHIGELYVKYLQLQFRGESANPGEKTIIVPRILRLLPGLTHLVLDFDCEDYPCWKTQPDVLKTSLHATFSLSLRCLRLTDLIFANVSELESLLSHAIGLKELLLDHIGFRDSSESVPHIGALDHHGPRIVLESLTLDSIDDAAETMVSSFSTVDITHLKSLVLSTSPVFPLLKANVQTLQKVRIDYFSDESRVDLDIFEGNRTLHVIEVTEVNCDMASTLQQLGHLGHLHALKRISLYFRGTLSFDNDTEVDWLKLNAIFAQAGGGLEDVKICASSEAGRPSDLALVRQRLPSVAARISHIDHTDTRLDVFIPPL
ncbi:hypothetical protein C8J57DRAFT_1308254 [Mycena rebaudengoi]|nr:hypothetical protein C8J57DRAFT_1308254 [Mycena rebaudengoi]